MRFDFDHEDFKKHHPTVQAFMRRTYGSGMSEEVFVTTYKSLPRPIGANGRPKSKRSMRSPAKLRQTYHRLNKRFSFF